jgi:lysophospholipase L1-like esterase
MWRNLALATLATALALAAVEGTLAALNLPAGRRDLVLMDAYRPDPELGYVAKPGASALWVTEEFREPRLINSRGLRDVEPHVKGPREVRVLAAGDSFTYGAGVRARESWPKVLQALWQGRDPVVSVVNAGTPGYGTDQAYRWVLLHGVSLQPDVVLVGIHCSDVPDDIRVSLYDVADGRLIALDARETAVFIQGVLARAVPRSVRRLRVFEVVLRSLRNIDAFGHRPRLPWAALENWAREKIRLELVDLSVRGHAAGFRTAAVLMPCKDSLGPDTPPAYGDLAPALERAGVPVLDATRALARDGRVPADLFFRVDMHLNVEGNRRLAQAVAAFLDERGLLPPQPSFRDRR